MFCKNCGHEINQDAKFCPKCGAKFTVDASEEAVKSKLAAGLLGIFLGELGIHRFYLGYIGIGIVQIVLTVLTFGIAGLWGFIEGILILTGNFNKDSEGRPLRDN